METYELLELLRIGQFANNFGHVQNSYERENSSLFGSHLSLFLSIIRAVRISFAAILSIFGRIKDFGLN